MSDWDAFPTITQTQSPPAPAPSAAGGWDMFPTLKQAHGVPDSIPTAEGGSAGALTAAGAGFADDPRAQMSFFAQARGIPVERYGVRDGKIGYVEGGKFHPEVQSIPERIASGVGLAIPAATGAAAGILTAPAALTGTPGLALNMGAAGAAQAAGQAVREGIAWPLTGQTPSLGRIGKNFLEGATTEGIGAGLNVLGMRGAAKDIGKLDPVAVGDLSSKAQKVGIDLAPAELTNLNSLKARQKALGNLSDSADTMQSWYQKRQGQVSSAIDNFLQSISPVDAAETAGDMGVSAAGKAVDSVTAARAAKASPLYREAFGSGAAVDTAPVLARIQEMSAKAPDKGNIRSALQRAGDLLTEAGPNGTRVPTSDLERLHIAKMELDDMIAGTRESSLGNTAKARVTEIKNQLLQQMDAASPKYGEARAIYADLSPGLERVKEGLTGKVSDLGQLQAQKAAQTLFGPSSGPQAITEAKAQLQQASPEAWQALKRSFIQDAFESAQKETASNAGGIVNVGGKFRSLLLGTPQAAKRIEAALEPGEFSALKDLGEVLDAAGRVKPIMSDTAWNQELMRRARDEATPWVAKAAKIGLSPLQWGNMISDALTERSLAKNSAKMAEAVTSPDGMKQLRELRMLSPTSARFRAGVAQLLGVGAQIGASETGLTGPADVAPGAP
jgi:hypothetical protein